MRRGGSPLHYGSVAPILMFSLSSYMQGVGQLLRVSPSCVETLEPLNCEVIHRYPLSDILEYHALATSSDR